MVATSAFGCGIDVGTVRAVVHIGAPDTLVESIQESGRAGRDGNLAKSMLILVKKKLDAQATNVLADTPFCPDKKIASIVDTRTSTKSIFGSSSDITADSNWCRRWILDFVADGMEQGLSCSARRMALCDICARQKPSVDSPVIQKSSKTTSDMGTECNGMDSTPTTEYSHEEIQRGMNTSPTKSSQKSSQQCASHILSLATEFQNVCPVCSINQLRAVVHKEEKPPCTNGRCLKCKTRGHNADQCLYIKKEENKFGCYQCSINKLDGFNLHLPDIYGRKTCPLKNLTACFLVAWENTSIRESLKNHHSSTRQLSSTEEYTRWFRGQSAIPGIGVTEGFPWLVEQLLSWPALKWFSLKLLNRKKVFKTY